MLVSAHVLTLVVAILHIWFLVLEMFLWTKPLGLKSFKMSATEAQATKVLAQNQGLYNGFLAASLIWGVMASEAVLVMFGLICVIIAGVFGAKSVSVRIFFIQSVPAILALSCLVLAQ